MRLSAFTIDTMTAQQLIDITKLYQPFNQDKDAVKTACERIIADPQQDLFVARFNDRHIGGLIIKYHTDSAELDCIAVRDITRGRGVGKFLLHQAIQKCKASDYKMIKVLKNESCNDELISFLKAQGFTELEKELEFTVV